MAKIDFDNHWYPFHYFRFGSKTARWTAERVGAYVNLLNYQWAYNGLPDDKEELLEIANCSAETLDKVLKEFSIKRGNKIFNEELEVLRKIQIAKYEKRANAGRKGGVAKKQSLSNATTMLEHSLSNGVATKQNKTEQNRTEQIAYNTEADKEIDTNVSIKKDEPKESAKHNFSKSPFYELEAFELEFIRLGDIKMPDKKIKPTEIDIEYYWNSAKDYGVDISHKYANWVVAVRSWIKQAPQKNKAIVYKKVEQLKEIYGNIPPPPKPPTKSAEQIHEEFLQIFNGNGK
jgi:uncharacterized protein YdaU (DUF1376 family)